MFAPTERLTAEQVARVCTGIWQIELVLEEVKSHFGLEGMPSRKLHIVEVLLYATLVTLVVSRRLLRAVRPALRGRPYAVPGGRWATIFAAVAMAILDVLLAPAHLSPDITRRTEAMLLHEALDPDLWRRALLARVEHRAA